MARMQNVVYLNVNQSYRNFFIQIGENPIQLFSF